MKFSWLFNGTMEAHHLAAVYVLVWVIQGGYAGWVVWQTLRTQRDTRAAVPLSSVTRNQP